MPMHTTGANGPKALCLTLHQPAVRKVREQGSAMHGEQNEHGRKQKDEGNDESDADTMRASLVMVHPPLVDHTPTCLPPHTPTPLEASLSYVEGGRASWLGNDSGKDA